MMSLLPYYTSRSYAPDTMLRSFFDDPFFSSFFFDRTPAVSRSPQEMRGMMRVDVEDTGESYLLTTDLPGVRKEDLKISVENGVLTISAEYNTERSTESNPERRYLYQERRSGSMSRSFSLEGVQEQDIHAEYTDGVLRVTLPKKIEPKAEGARTIEIR